MKNSSKESYLLCFYRKSDNRTFTEFLETLPNGYKGMVFREVEKDTVGKSGSNPTWVSSYYYDSKTSYYNENELSFDEETKKSRRMALYKEYDYDEPMAAYAEKIWSLLGKNILPRCRVPDIDVVYKSEKAKDLAETISYRVLDRDTEELILMSVVLDFKYASEKNKMRNYCRIEEILECIKQGRYYTDESNYLQIEEDIIHTALLDCISNNGDRHPKNWGIVMNKMTGEYSVALFDHSNSFRNVISPQVGMRGSNWCTIYFRLDEKYKERNLLCGESGDKMIQYLYSKYPQYVNSFMKNFESGYPNFTEEINRIQMFKDGGVKVDSIIKDIKNKANYIHRVLDERGEIYGF